VHFISLDFVGYWPEVNKKMVPAESGVYLVYVCQYNAVTNHVTLEKLIYIGEADDARAQISTPEKLAEWRKEAPEGSQLCFSFAGITGPDRERAKCALIYHHKPECNEECKDSFPFEDTIVQSMGRCSLLTSMIRVEKTQKPEDQSKQKDK